MEKTLGFYDIRTKKKFSSSDYKIVKKKGKRFAVAISPDGNECWRLLGKD